MKKIQKIIEKYEYISFDIFDTLIKRNVERPSDIFRLVEKEYIKRYGKDNAISNFVEKRIQAERIARQEQTEEITIEQIYAVLSNDNSEKVAKLYKELEIEIEVDICIAHKNVKKIYEKCVELDKNIYIISDMYLSLETIKKILEKNGYKNYKKIYLSSQVGKTKAKGELFDYVLEKEALKGSQLLHIGDNIRADIRNAFVRKIHTYYVQNKNRQCEKSLLDVKCEVPVLQNYLQNVNFNSDNFYYEIGYMCFGPLLYGFIDWIKSECKKNKYERVFFLSRDGYIMNQVYSAIKDEEDTSNYYMYASRRALQGPAIHLNPDYESVMKSMFLPKYVTVSWLIKRWGLIPDKYQEIVELNGLTLDKEIASKDILHNNSVKVLFECIKNDIINNSKKEYEAFCLYLKQIGFQGNVAIVDIGWFGNMQNSLMKVLNEIDYPVKVTGYYLGIVPESQYQERYDMKGYLFQKNKNEELFYRFKFLNSMLEILFMAPHGTINRYINLDNKVEMLPFEYEGTNTESGVLKIQKGAMDFIKNYTNSIAQYVENNPMMYLDNLYSRLMRPDLETSKKLGDFAIWDDEWKKMAPKVRWFHIIKNPKKLVRSFGNASWKMGYLKRLFKIPLRYDLITFRLRSIYKKLKI